MIRRFVHLPVLLSLVLAACGGAATPAAGDPPVATEQVPAATGAPADAGTAPSPTQAAPATILPTWLNGPFVEVTSGQTLTAADFQGKVLLVETMAIWCTNCRQQQGEVRTLHERLGERDDLVSLVLDIDPNEDAAALKEYVATRGFVGWYAVAPAEVAAALAREYGPSLLNPPSVPMLIVDRTGEVHLLPYGAKSAEALANALAPYL